MLISLKDTTKISNFDILTLRSLWHVAKLRNIFLDENTLKIVFIILNTFYMTISIYKCGEKVYVIEKITKLYLILQTNSKV